MTAPPKGGAYKERIVKTMKTCRTMPGIRTRRLMIGLSVQEAADALGVTRQGWYAWESGKSLPWAGYLPGLAELLQCGIEDLYREEDGHDQTADEAGGM